MTGSKTTKEERLEQSEILTKAFSEIEFKDLFKEFLSHIKYEDENTKFDIDKYENIEDAIKYIIKCLNNNKSFKYYDGNDYICSIDSTKQLTNVFESEIVNITYDITIQTLNKNNNLYNIVCNIIESYSSFYKEELKYYDEEPYIYSNFIEIIRDNSKDKKDRSKLIVGIIENNESLFKFSSLGAIFNFLQNPDLDKYTAPLNNEIKFEEFMEKEFFPNLKNWLKTETDRSKLQLIINSKHATIEEKIFEITNNHLFGNDTLKTLLKNFYKKNYNPGKDITEHNKMLDQIQNKYEVYQEFINNKFNNFIKSKENMEIALKTNGCPIMATQPKIGKILINNCNKIEITDDFISKTKDLLKLIYDLDKNFQLLTDDYKRIIKPNKDLFNKISEKIDELSCCKDNKDLKKQLKNCIFDKIIDKYMKIHNNKKYEEKLTLDNVYRIGKHKTDFEKIAIIFLGNEKTLETYCKERNKEKFEENKLKENEYIEEKENNEFKIGTPLSCISCSNECHIDEKKCEINNSRIKPQQTTQVKKGYYY